MTDLLSRVLSTARSLGSGKGMVDLHPEVQERVHLATIRSDEMLTSGYNPYSYLNALGDYEGYTWVRKAVMVIANNLAALPLKVLQGEESVEGHPLLTLLTDINDQMSSGDLWLQWTIDMLLGGEEGWELVRDGRGNYVEIWPRQPHIVQVIPDKANARYYGVAEYRIDDGLPTPGDPTRTGYTLQPDEFIHFKFFNPRNPWRGIGVFTAVRNAIILDQMAQAWARLFFRKSARPDYALITPQGLTPGERIELENLLETKFGGIANAHRPIILEQGVTDVKVLSFPPKDMEWIEQRGMSREEVGAVAGVPDEIMGWGRDTYENFDTALRVLWSLTIQPIATYRDGHITEYFRRQRMLKPGERLVSDYSNVAALQEDLSAKLDQAVKLFGLGYPANAINDRLRLGMPTIEGGDVGYLPFGVAPATRLPDGKPLPLIEDPNKPAAAPALADIPADTPPADMPADMPSDEPPAKGRRERAARATRHAIAYGSDEHKQLWDEWVKALDPQERSIRDMVVGLFEDQRAAVLARLRAGAKSPRSAADEPFDRDEWDRKFKDAGKPVLRKVVDAGGKRAMDALDIGLAFDVDAPAVARFIRERAQRFAESVNETTWDRLRNSLGDGLDAGEGLRALEARVEEIMGDRIRSSSEAIARTEAVGAMNGGQLEAWDQSEVVTGKIWLATLDDRVRDTHSEAHGQEVGLDEDFEVGSATGPGPGQMGEAEEDINCRCTMNPVLDEKAVKLVRQWRFAVAHIGNGNGHTAPAR